MSTEYLLPVADGNYTAFTASGCAADWQCVDDPVGSPDDATTRLTLSGTTTPTRQSVVVAAYSQGGTINSVTVTGRATRSGTGTASIRIFLRIGGTDYDGDSQNLPSAAAYANYTQGWTTNPATGLAWTTADLAALEAGVLITNGGITNTSSVTQVYAAIDYTIPDPREQEPLTFYLLPQPSTAIFTGRVASAPADPYTDISYSAGVTGSFGAPLPGQSVWFGSTSGGKERGVRRLRSWSGGGTLTIDESDDVGPLIQANDYITIRWDFRLWPKYPYFLQSGETVTTFEDRDIAFSNQTLNWYPVAVPPPPGVGFIEAGQTTINFVDRSQALAAGATITNWLWKAWDSAEGTSTSQGTEASPVAFTYTSPGWHLVSLTVTDSNANSHTAYTWAIVIDPDDPEAVAFIDFDAANDNADFEQGGGACSFAVRGTGATVATFPEECLIVHAVRGDMTTPTGSWPYRTNVLFVGYVLGDSARQDPDTSEVTFRAGTIDTVMRNTSAFPVSLTNKATPTEWTQGANLTVGRVLSYMYKWRSTLDTMTPVILPDYSGLIARQDFGKDRLYDRVNSDLMRSMWGKAVATHQSVLYHVIDYNLQNAVERATATTRKTLHKGVWINDVTIEERSNYDWTANQVEMSGVAYNGGDIEQLCPLFSQAPGDAMKAYGNQLVYDRLILLTQADLNVRCGHALVKANHQYPIYRMQFINDGSFTIGPQELFPAVIESGDNNRGISYTGNLIPRRINRQYDHAGGYFIVSVDFEPESSGEPGVTVEVDCSPPSQKATTTQPPPVADGGPVALVAGTTGTSFYFEPGLTRPWQRRVSGLADPEQIGFLDQIPDPWSTFKQGYSPDKTIIWGAGRGFLVRSVDSGTTWKDRSSYIDAPAWPGETGTALTSVELARLQADIFNENRLFVLARWQYGSDYHGAVYKATDGFDFTVHNLTGTSQCRPLGMSLDKGGTGALYVTTWENGAPTGLYLRVYDTDDMSLLRRVSLGAASSADVDAQMYYANPFNRLGAADEVYLFGRMNQPQGFTGTVHVLSNDGAGATGSYSVVENTWSTDLCAAFGADEDGNLYAVRATV